VPYVVEVILDPLLDRRVPPPAVHLSPSGDTHFEEMPSIVVTDGVHELLNKKGAFRSGADHAHVTLEDIEELGQFIQTSFAKNLANAGAARIVSDCPTPVSRWPRYRFRLALPVPSDCACGKYRREYLRRVGPILS